MRLVIVSNRLPFTVSFKEGKPEFKPSAGGLTTGLWSYLNRKAGRGTERPDFLWMGWPGASVPPEHEAAVRTYGAEQYKSSPVFLPEESMDRFYLGFCNKTIWPLFHYFPTLTSYEEEYWEEYRHINRGFRRGGGQGAATGRLALDSRLSPDAAAETGAGKISRNADWFFSAHSVSVVGNVPDAAAGVAGGNHRGAARGQRDRFSHSRLCPVFSDLGAAHGRI